MSPSPPVLCQQLRLPGQGQLQQQQSSSARAHLPEDLFKPGAVSGWWLFSPGTGASLIQAEEMLLFLVLLICGSPQHGNVLPIALIDWFLNKFQAGRTKLASKGSISFEFSAVPSSGQPLLVLAQGAPRSPVNLGSR